MQVGTISGIWRYPVKSMQGEPLDEVQVLETGLLGDRCWAVRNESVGEVQGAKQFPKLLQCRSRFLAAPEAGKIAPVEIEWPDGRRCSSDSASMAEMLEQVTEGVEASLWPLQPAEDAGFYRRRQMTESQFAEELAQIFQREPGEPLPDVTQFPPELMEYTSMPGMFFDVTPLHLLTTASLNYMRVRNLDAVWDPKRFRPNFLIDTVDPDAGLVENQWLGKSVRIGELEIQCVAPTPRCGMVTREQEGLSFDKSILRTVVREADQNLGIYAVITRPGRVRMGDALTVL